MKHRARRRFWNTCQSCGDGPVAGCVCFYCLRMAVIAAAVTAALDMAARWVIAKCLVIR